MVGQRKIQALIESINNKNFPNPLLLVGDKGCGKRLVTSIISIKNFRESIGK